MPADGAGGGAVSQEESSWKFQQGDEIVPGRYALRLLGEGRLCEVYLAWDEGLYCLVVAKVARPHLVDHPRTRRRLVREIEALNRLAHPMIPRCFEAVLDGERPHLVQEYVEGFPLSAFVGRHRLPLDQLLPLFLRVCSALHYLARREMVHLDVKPSNIVTGAHPRLVDFSLARGVDDAGKIRRRTGTDPYMAPEQCDPPKRGQIGPHTDIWGLGATMYHAIAGRRPFPREKDFDEKDLLSKFPQLVHDPDRLPRGTPPEVHDIILRCLKKEQSARPTAAGVATVLEPLVVLPL